MYLKLPENNEISAILPIYTAVGDKTIILTSTCTTMSYNVKPAAIVNRLAARQCIELSTLKKQTKKLIHSSEFIPLVLAPNLVLIPLKIRQPRIKGDVTSAFVNYLKIISLFQTDQHTCRINLLGNHPIESLWQKNTIDKHLNMTYIAYHALSNSIALIPLLLSSFNERYCYNGADNECVSTPLTIQAGLLYQIYELFSHGNSILPRQNHD